MSKIITWSTSKYSDSAAAHETDSLYYAEDIIRHWKFRSPISIKFCLEHSIPYMIDNHRIIVPPGGYFVANDGLEMECLPCRPGAKALIVFFTRELIADVKHNRCSGEKMLLDNPYPDTGSVNFFQHVYRYPNPLSAQLLILAKRMAGSGTSANDLPPDIFYNLAENLFSLQADISRQIGRVNARRSITREELFRRVLRAKEFMQDNWHKDLTLNDVSRFACLSPYHFHRSFREAFRQPPMRWFRQLKLKKAKEMLASKQMTVTQAALDCGFSDVFSFSKAFKRELGVNPSGA